MQSSRNLLATTAGTASWREQARVFHLYLTQGHQKNHQPPPQTENQRNHLTEDLRLCATFTMTSPPPFPEISCAQAVCRLDCQLKHHKLDVKDERSMNFAAPPPYKARAMLVIPFLLYSSFFGNW